MELRHLRYFVAVAEKLSFSRASESLHIAQSPLSQQIRQLESELGVELLRRNTRHVELTEPGRVLLGRAYGILASVREATHVTRRAGEGRLGYLKLGFTGSATYKMMPTIARAFAAECPEVELDLHGEMLSSAQLEALLKGNLDAGFVRLHDVPTGIAARRVGREPLAILLPKGHRLARLKRVPLSSLADDMFISYPGYLNSTMHKVAVRACLDAGFHPSIAHEVGETSMLVSLVAAGSGVALIPDSVRHLTVAGAVVRPLAPPDISLDLSVAWREESSSPVLHRFLEATSRILAGWTDTGGD